MDPHPLRSDMETIRQCWAYNHRGQRCEHPAGHPGNHVISDEWSDDDCFTPTSPAIKPVVPPPVPVAAPTAGKCVACSHAHKAGTCKCGCHEHIG